MQTKPVNLTEALASFDDIYSPRIVARMNDYDIRVVHTLGEHVWHEWSTNPRHRADRS